MAYAKFKDFLNYEEKFIVYEKRTFKGGDKKCQEIIGGNFILWPIGVKERKKSKRELEPYVECGFDSDENEDDIPMKLEGGTYSLQISIPKTLLKSLVGIKGRVKKEIEVNSGATILVPLKNSYGPVEIKGSSRKAVIKGKNQIELVALKARHEQPFTHFLSIPMTSNEIKANFNKFKAELLANKTEYNGIYENLFMNPNKLHLTIGTLVLNTDEELSDARVILQRFKDKFIEPILKKSKKLYIEMKGLEYMNDDPSEVNVLYAKVKLISNKVDIFQELSDKLVSYFIEEGLMLSKYDRVKLHATLLNSRFQRDRNGFMFNTENETISREFETKCRDSFDATNILKKYSDFYFGKQPFETIHLSIRNKTGSDGYYKCQFNIDFNDCYS